MMDNARATMQVHSDRASSRVARIAVPLQRRDVRQSGELRARIALHQCQRGHTPAPSATREGDLKRGPGGCADVLLACR